MAALAEGLAVLAVGFDDDPGWSGPFLLDRDRRLYARLGMARAPWWRVWSPRTLLFYARVSRRESPSGPVDVFQMGGDAVVRDGLAVRCWLPRTPMDRVAPSVLVAAARSYTESM